jgi:hypothetical protein
MYGAIPPLLLHAFVASIWTTRVGIRERSRTETCQVVELKEVSIAIVVITINEAWWVGLTDWGAGEQSGVAAECVDPGGSSRQKCE